MTDIRMPKPVELEKVGADSPLEGTGKMFWAINTHTGFINILYAKIKSHTCMISEIVLCVLQ